LQLGTGSLLGVGGLIAIFICDRIGIEIFIPGMIGIAGVVLFLIGTRILRD